MFLKFMTGACFGSFLFCIIWRIRRNEDWITGRSHCDSCGRRLLFIDLIPVFSFILLGGRCRYCGSGIPVTGFLAELVCGILFMMLF